MCSVSRTETRPRGVVVFGDVGQIEETLQVPPGRLARRREPRVIAVEVDRLLVVGHAGVLGAGVGLVEADVVVVERPLCEIDDGGMHADPVEGTAAGKGEGGHPALLGGTEPGPFVGPDESLLGLLGTASALLVHALGVGLVLLGAREDLAQVVGQGVDLLGADEALEQDPALVAPRRHLGVRRQSCTHEISIARERCQDLRPSQRPAPTDFALDAHRALAALSRALRVTIHRSAPITTSRVRAARPRPCHRRRSRMPPRERRTQALDGGS